MSNHTFARPGIFCNGKGVIMDNVISELRKLLARSNIQNVLPATGGHLLVIDTNSPIESFRIGHLLGLLAKGRAQ
jgi:hypothetical protein